MNVQDIINAEIHFYDHRGKHVGLLTPGSSERDVAEKIQALRDEGVTYLEIANRSGLSLSTCRRMLRRLNLTRSIEKGERDKELARLVKERAKEMRRQAKEQGARTHEARTERKPLPDPVPQATRRAG